MHFQLPPTFAPPCGLTNCLSSNSGDTRSTTARVSLLTATGAELLAPHARPSEDVTWDGPSKSGTATYEEKTLPVRTAGATAHAVGPGGVVVHAGRRLVCIRRISDGTIVSTWDAPLSFTPRDVACADLEKVGAVAAAAGSDGVWLFSKPGASSRRLHGTEGHSCVAVNICSSGHLACATVYGRVAVWQWNIDGDSEEAEFIATAAFDPQADYAVQDRVIQVLFAPRSAAKVVLCVSWWSGRVCAYEMDESSRWMLSWTHSCPSDPLESFGTAPGTFLAFNADGTVVAAVAGHGVVQFLAIIGGVVVCARRVLPSRRKKAVLYVKGVSHSYAGDEDVLLAVVRGHAQIIESSFPPRDMVLGRIADEEKRKQSDREEQSGEVLYRSEEVTLRGGNGATALLLQLRAAKTPRKIPLPLGATDIVLSPPPEDVDAMKPDRLYASSASCCAKYLAIAVKSFILVYDMDASEWSAIVPSCDIHLCGFALRHKGGKTAESLSERGITTPDLLVCIAGDGLTARRWSVKDLKPLDAGDASVQLPGVVGSLTGCLSCSGYFACLCASTEPEMPPKVSFVAPDQYVSQTLLLPDNALPPGTGDDPCRITALWCSPSAAVFVLSRTAQAPPGVDSTAFVSVRFVAGKVNITAHAVVLALGKLPGSLKSAQAIVQSAARRAEAAMRNLEIPIPPEPRLM
jgi:hypothetical protein